MVYLGLMRLSLPRKRVLIWYYCALTAAVLLVGTLVLHGWMASNGGSQGTVLLLASGRTADHLVINGTAVHSHAGWQNLSGRFDGSVARAPDTTTLARTSLAPGTYDALRVGDQVLQARITIGTGQVAPVLVTVAQGRAQPDGVYAGTDQFNLGLNELGGQVTPMSDFQLVDQNGHSVDKASLHGRVVVVAAFHTSCQTTCPLYSGLFLQLRRQLPPSVLLVEATTDPEVDTPQALKEYGQRIGADWTFLTGTRAQLTAFWGPLGVQLSGAQLHSSTLAVIDSHGYIRSVYQGVPDIGGGLPGPLLNTLNQTGRQQLASHGDGWGLTQVMDTLAAVDRPSQQPPSGADQAPAFSATDLNGKPISLSQLRGRPVLLNFWASWCSPCRQEMPLIQQAARAHPQLAVVLINERDDSGSARRFLAELGVNLAVATDPNGNIGGAYKVNGLPVSVFVRADGTVSSRYPGAMDQRTLATHLAGLGIS